MKKLFIFALFTVILTACPTPDCPDPEPCPECPPVDTAAILAKYCPEPVVIDTAAILAELCPECPECPEVDTAAILENCPDCPEPDPCPECPCDTTCPEPPPANGFFVAPNGNNYNPGTIDMPWATWDHALESIDPGDTVYVRGGIYYNTGAVWVERISGTVENPLHLFAYPGETPILDGIRKTSPSPGFVLYHCENIHIKGLHVRNNLEIVDNYKYASNIIINQCENIIAENCVSYNSGRRGFFVFRSDEIYLLNCDSYNNCDSLDTSYRGGGGDGFLVWDDGAESDLGKAVYLFGCRAWNNSDDGYDIETEGLIVAHDCYAIANGYLDGDGTGFKIGYKDRSSDDLCRDIEGCISAFNTSSGFTTNDRTSRAMWMELDKNISYGNGGSGFIAFDTPDSQERERMRKFTRNIAHRNMRPFGLMNDGAVTQSGNSWNMDVTVSDDWFISVDREDWQNNPDFLKPTPATVELMGW